MFIRSNIALVYRNIRSVYDNAFIVHQVILPVMIVFIGGYSLSAVVASGINVGNSHIPYITYLTSGLIGYNVLWTCVISGTVIWNDRRNGMLEQILVMPFTRSQYIISNIITLVILGIIGGAVIVIIGFPFLIGYVQLTFLGLVYILYSLINAAIIFGSIVIMLSLLVRSDDVLSFQVETGIVSGTFGFLSVTSTIYYPSEAIPEPFTILSLLNPLTYVVNIMRDSMFSNITLFTNTQVILVGIISILMFLLVCISVRNLKV